MRLELRIETLTVEGLGLSRRERAELADSVRNEIRLQLGEELDGRTWTERRRRPAGSTARPSADMPAEIATSIVRELPRDLRAGPANRPFDTGGPA